MNTSVEQIASEQIIQAGPSIDAGTAGPRRSLAIRNLTGRVTIQDELAVAHGDFADVYTGTLLDRGSRITKVRKGSS